MDQPVLQKLPPSFEFECGGSISDFIYYINEYKEEEEEEEKGSDSKMFIAICDTLHLNANYLECELRM